MQNTTIENNVVYGEPAGDQAVAITASTEMVSSPRMRVWVWPDGPFAMSDENVAVANSIITAVARPVFQSIQAVRLLTPSTATWVSMPVTLIVVQAALEQQTLARYLSVLACAGYMCC